MDSQSDFLELLILGAIAAFLIYRLVAALGQRTGFEKPMPKESFEDDSGLASGPASDDMFYEEREEEEEREEDIPPQIRTQVLQIKKIDADFSWKTFLEGASAAYEMVLEAFAKDDRAALKSLLSQEIYDDFVQALEVRASQGKVLQTTLIRMTEIVCEKILQKGAQVSIQLRYVTEQTHVVRNKKGTILEGSPKQVEEIVDTWTFSRNLKSSNPNWTLVEIEN